MMRCLIYNVNRGRGLNKLRSIHKVLSKPTVPTGSSQSPPCHPPEHMFPWKQMPGALKGNFSCDWICRMKPPNAYEGSSRNAGFWELLLAGSGARPWGAVASGAGALNESGDELNSTMMCLHPWERLRACSYSLLVVYGLACTETFDYGSRGTSLLLSPLSQGWVHTVSTCIIHLAQGTIAEVTMSLILPSVHLPISRFHCRRALPCPTKSLWALASDRPGLKLQLFHLRIGRELLGESYSRVGGWRLEGGGPFWAKWSHQAGTSPWELSPVPHSLATCHLVCVWAIMPGTLGTYLSQWTRLIEMSLSDLWVLDPFPSLTGDQPYQWGSILVPTHPYSDALNTSVLLACRAQPRADKASY